MTSGNGPEGLWTKKRFNEFINVYSKYFTMKKIYLMWAVAAVAMTGCSKSEVVDQAPDAQTGKIGFMSHVSKNTRTVTDENLSQFYVYGSYRLEGRNTQVFNEKPVSKVAPATEWTYEGTRYWVNNATYKFYAYSYENGVNAAASYVLGNEAHGLFSLVNYRVDADHNQGDMVFAESATIPYTDGDAAPAKVAFSFKHLLARICFTFVSEFPEGNTVTVEDVTVSNIRNRATFATSTGAASAWNTPERYPEDAKPTVVAAINPEKNVATVAEEEKAALKAGTGFAYVLPHNYSEAAGAVGVQFRITVKNANGDFVSEGTLSTNITPAWVMGHTYNYKATIKPAAVGLHPIEFDITSCEEWVESPEDLGNLTLENN